jgi:hypothetical protein
VRGNTVTLNNFYEDNRDRRATAMLMWRKAQQLPDSVGKYTINFINGETDDFGTVLYRTVCNPHYSVVVTRLPAETSAIRHMQHGFDYTYTDD